MGFYEVEPVQEVCACFLLCLYFCLFVFFGNLCDFGSVLWVVTGQEYSSTASFLEPSCQPVFLHIHRHFWCHL